MDERPVLEERYASAVRSSHLRSTSERAGDVDLLVAAGWVREGLATAMYRVRGEFDCVKGEARVTNEHLAQLRAQRAERWDQAETEAKATRFGPTRTVLYRQQCTALDEQIEREALTARAFILIKLKSLTAVTRALRHYAEQQASRRGFMEARPGQAYRIVGHALDLMLDPLCAPCDGRGFTGGYLKHKVICTACKGAGRRPLEFGGIEADLFGRWLIADVERKLARVEKLMRGFLNAVQSGQAVRVDVERVEASTAELTERLAALRSAQAAAD